MGYLRMLVLHILYGSASGVTSVGDGLYHQNSSGWPGVSESGDLFGYSVDVADIDRDGIGDLIVVPTAKLRKFIGGII